MRRLRRWYIPACRGQRGPAGSAGPQAGAGLRAGRRRPAARIAAAVYVSPELYSLPVSQEFASLRPPLGGRTRLVIVIRVMVWMPDGNIGLNACHVYLSAPRTENNTEPHSWLGAD